MTQELFRQGAYHESGHIIVAYLSRYKSDRVELILDDPGSGMTKFDYGGLDMTMAIASMQNYTNNPELYNDLPAGLKNICPEVAFKITGTLLGGPVSEALYATGIDFVGNLPIEMSGPDLISVQNIHHFLSDIVTNHKPNYIEHSLSMIVQLLKQQEFWDAIKHLSDSILSSPNKQLNRDQIEQSLKASGYLAFIN
jgi:hypothetical protein